MTTDSLLVCYIFSSNIKKYGHGKTGTERSGNLVPLLLKVALSYCIDPVHFGIIFLAISWIPFLSTRLAAP
jgi:hypothetical protein